MIYICIPTHNEQQTVGVILWKLRQVLTDFPRDYQLLVADDASTDKTPEVLEPYTRVLPLTVIRSDRRQGYAASLEMLMREAVRRSEYPKRDVIVALQADFSDEPDDLVALVKRLEAGADIAVGNKVSTTPDTRGRSFSRSLARFFTRRQKWPEGVQTPFDGYRAYRLYAVRKAIEERAGSRLIRYDGWAGHAELLRAVLPHARRVDVVDVDDRPDRLQRPRREKPFAAAMQVRAMSSGTEPAGLTGVEELDRIAATASRSRDRGALVVSPTQNGRSRTNGNRTRTPRTDGRQRSGGASERRPDRSRAGKPGRGEERQPRQRSAEARAGTESPRAERPQRPKRERRPTEARRTRSDREASAPDDENVTAAADESTVPMAAGAAPGVVDAAADGGSAKPKRRRRRRRKSGSKTTSDAAASSPETVEPEASAAGDGSDEGEQQTEGAAPKKRRRRGGRRGGRGRRKQGTDGAPEGGADGDLSGTPDVEPQGAAGTD